MVRVSVVGVGVGIIRGEEGETGEGVLSSTITEMRLSARAGN